MEANWLLHIEMFGVCELLVDVATSVLLPSLLPYSQPCRKICAGSHLLEGSVKSSVVDSCPAHNLSHLDVAGGTDADICGWKVCKSPDILVMECSLPCGLPVIASSVTFIRTRSLLEDCFGARFLVLLLVTCSTHCYYREKFRAVKWHQTGLCEMEGQSGHSEQPAWRCVGRYLAWGGAAGSEPGVDFRAISHFLPGLDSALAATQAHSEKR